MVSMAAVSTLSWPDSGVAGAGAGAGRGQEGEVGGTAEFLREMGAERDQEGEGDLSSSEPRCGEGEVIRLDTGHTALQLKLQGKLNQSSKFEVLIRTSVVVCMIAKARCSCWC